MTTITEAWNHDYKDEKLEKETIFISLLKKRKVLPKNSRSIMRVQHYKRIKTRSKKIYKTN